LQTRGIGSSVKFNFPGEFEVALNFSGYDERRPIQNGLPISIEVILLGILSLGGGWIKV